MKIHIFDHPARLSECHMGKAGQVLGTNTAK